METKDYLSVTGLIGFFLFVSVVVPVVIGFAEQGFDTQHIMTQYVMYASISISFLIIFIFWLYVQRSKRDYGTNLFFAAKGEEPSLPFFKRFTYPQLILLSSIIFGTLFLFISQIRQTAFTGFQVVQQQFTPGASIIFSAFLVPAPENALLGAFIAGLVIGMMKLSERFNLSRTTYNGFIYLLLPVLGGLLGLSIHLLRYGSNEWNLLVVFLFWTMIALLAVISGTFVIGWVLHVMNNLFFDMKVYFSNESVFLYGILLILILVGIYYLFYKNKLLGEVDG